MTIHAFIGEKASRTHENLMLQKFLECLEDRWSGSRDWIYVIANALWEGAEIDLVCLLPNMILVADFKNFAGTLTGGENGPWFADGIPVKGGAQHNPFAQLRNNRFSLLHWLEHRMDLQGRNLGHISAAPVFSGPIKDQLDLPAKVRSWFHVTDLEHCTGLLDALASPELRLSQNEADAIIRLLGVTEHRWMRYRPQLLPIGGNEPTLQHLPMRHPLMEHQCEVLQGVRSFLSSDTDSSMTILGMKSTGKSRLHVEAIKEIKEHGLEPIPLASNRRLALTASVKWNIGITSIYHHLYLNDTTENIELISDSKQKKDKSNNIPLRICTDPEDCVYLIDDAHLLSDAYFEPVGGRVFGSGHLISDFMTFSGLGTGRRKAIFVGDPYQIKRGGDLSILDGTYQKKHGIANIKTELDFQVTEDGDTALLRNARMLAKAIHTNRYSTMDFEVDDDFRIIAPRLAADELEVLFSKEPFSVVYLAETNAAIAAYSGKIRQKILGNIESCPFAVGDVIELDSVFMSPSDNPDLMAYLQPGARYRIEKIGKVEPFEQSLKGRAHPVPFRLLSWAKLSGTDPTCHSDSGIVANLLEDYIKSEKPELSTDLAIALRVWSQQANTISTPPEATLDGEGQDVVTGELSRITLARYGYGSTVHHGQGLAYSLCYLNARHSTGRHSEGYFRWLYTALTVAKTRISIIYFEPLDPFTGSQWNETQAKKDQDISLGRGWSFDPQRQLSDAEKRIACPAGLANSKDQKTSIAIYLRIVRALEATGWVVSKIDPHPFREIYTLIGPTGSASLGITYNASNIITRLHIHESNHWLLLMQLSHSCVTQCVYSLTANQLLEVLLKRGIATDWLPVSAAETKYRLIVVLAGNADEIVELEIDFRDDGRASNVRPKKFTSPEALAAVKELFQ